MEQENRELRAEIVELRLHAEDLKVQLYTKLADRDRRSVEPAPTFVPETTNNEETEQDLVLMLKRFSQAKIITKEIRDMDEKWKRILSTNWREKPLKSQSMFNLRNKES
jgi:hypothetical protein